MRHTRASLWISGVGAPALAILLALTAPRAASAQRPAGSVAHIGVLLDGAAPLPDSARRDFEREILSFFGPGRVDFPASARIAADWTVAGVQEGLDRLLANKGVDLVLALGPIGSHELARRRSLPKPAIAALVVDAAVQELPQTGGTSGVRNLSYVDVAYGTARTLEVLHRIVPYHRLAVLVHPGVMAAVPQFETRLREQGQAVGAAVTIVPVTGSAAEALRALPSDADAVYLGSLEQLSPIGYDSLIQGLNARRLPTLSVLGRYDVERGVLASYAARDDLARRARRVAGNIQRILGGEDAGSLPVSLVTVSQLTLNMATARAIGFSPEWAVLTEAELLHEEGPASGPAWNLAEVAREAIKVNLDLQEADRTVAAGEQNTRQSRAALLPQVQASATGTMVREETASASLGTQPERQATAAVSFSQSLYDDENWANYQINRHAQEGRVADRRLTELDVVLQATTAYLSVLRTRAIARVERENVMLTRSNLEVAQLKEQAGAGGLSDVYRWQAELAQSRRRVLDADAQVQLAGLDLNRALNRPLEEAFRTTDAGTDDPALLISEPRLLGYFGNPTTFAVFRDFLVKEGLAAAPELQALDARIRAEERTGTAARRSFFLPSLTLSGGVSSVLSRGGAGTSAPSLPGFSLSGQPDESWSLKLQASLPLFTGFAQSARLARANLEVDRLNTSRQSTEQEVSRQIRGALQIAAASWANIAQAREAALASRKNLELVTDAYGRGAINVITLLDAQQAALSANEAAANAVYDFLIDLMRAQRATGQFDFFLSAEARAAYFERLDAFFQAAGVRPLDH